MWQTAVGLAILAVLQNGLNLLDINNSYQYIIKGCLIIIAAASMSGYGGSRVSGFCKMRVARRKVPAGARKASHTIIGEGKHDREPIIIMTEIVDDGKFPRRTRPSCDVSGRKALISAAAHLRTYGILLALLLLVAVVDVAIPPSSAWPTLSTCSANGR